MGERSGTRSSAVLMAEGCRMQGARPIQNECVGAAAGIAAGDCAKPEGYGSAAFWARPMRQRGGTELAIHPADSLVFREPPRRTNLAALATGERVAERGPCFFGRLFKSRDDVWMIGRHIVALAD